MASVALFGAFGCVARYLLGLGIATNLPTLTAYLSAAMNGVGSFAIGFAFAMFATKVNIPTYLKLGITTGFLGGFTTFSALSLEVLNLFADHRYLAATLYGAGSMVMGPLLTYIGYALALSIFATN